MLTPMNDPNQAMTHILELGPYIVFAFFADWEQLLNAVLELPYTQIKDSKLVCRPGTEVILQEGVEHEDGTIGWGMLTGGNISPAECQRVIDVISTHGQFRFRTSPKDSG